MPKIEFIPNHARKPQGLTGSNIQQFRDDPYRSCARETGQNSNDARLKTAEDGTPALPVRLEYNLIRVKRSDLPFADEAKEVVTACLEESTRRCTVRRKNPEKDQEVCFFQRAEKTLAADEIPILEIADYNTTGLSGAFDDPDSVYNSLVKADGDNNKQDPDSGGSFGIGKNAAFAVSDIQTVLYATVTDQNGSDAFGCQARFQLISHKRDENEYSAEGYWGEENFYAITSSDGLPEWIARSDRGTSIFAIGFRHDEHWAERMALSIVTNFMRAIMEGRMEFSIDSGRFQINRSTLSTYLNDATLADVAEETGQREALQRTQDIHTCFTSGASETAILQTGNTKGAQLHILVSEDLKQLRSVLIVRKGMYITDNLRDFGDAFKSFSGTKPFVAVLEPTDDNDGRKFSEYLKRMENPEHDNFSAERLDVPEEIKAARKLIRNLAKDIRTTIRAAAGVEESESTSLDELAPYFQGDPQQAEDAKSKEPDSERFITGRAKKTKTRSQPTGSSRGKKGGSDNVGTSGAGSGSSSGSGSGGVGPSPGNGSGANTPSVGGASGSGTKEVIREIALSGKRCSREASEDSFTHCIYFTPSSSGTAAIKINASGLTSPAALSLASCDSGQISNGLLVIELESGDRKSVCVSFSEPYDGPIEFSSVRLEEEVSP